MSQRKRSRRKGQGEPDMASSGQRPGFDFKNMTLRDLRFETPEASEQFMNLRYLNRAFKGSTDNGVRLPPVDESVSTTPASGGMVYKAFPHGLMYGDQLSLMNGIAFFGCVASAGPILFFEPFGELFERLFSFRSDSLFSVIESSVFLLLKVVIAPLFLLMLVADFIGFRFDTSVLFDRYAGKVHVFSDRSLPWNFWKHDIQSYDWQCVRGEVDTVHVFTGAFGRHEAGLRCVVMDQPGGNTVVDQFVLGINMPAHHIQPLLDTWEHVRRFMQREGPLFANETDQPDPGLGRQSLWSCLKMFPALHVSGMPSLFKLGWEQRSPITLFMAMLGVVLLPAVPFLAFFGLFPWISGLVKREPKWPAEILASVGGNALKGRDLDAWRSVVPQGPVAIDGDARPALR